LKEWCGDHLWAPSCYHGSVGAGWDVVEKYISAHNTCGDHLWAPSCYHGSVGAGWDVVEKYISAHNTYNRR